MPQNDLYHCYLWIHTLHHIELYGEALKWIYNNSDICKFASDDGYTPFESSSFHNLIFFASEEDKLAFILKFGEIARINLPTQ